MALEWLPEPFLLVLAFCENTPKTPKSAIRFARFDGFGNTGIIAMTTPLARFDSLSLSLEAALDEFLAHCRMRQLSPTTLEWYRYCLRPFVDFAEQHGEKDVECVTAKTVQAFLGQQSAVVQAVRLNHYREAIERLYDWLIKGQHATANPVADIPKVREPKRLIAAFSEDEMAALLSQPDTRTFLGLRDYLFMLVLLDTGIRLSEALGLQVRDVDINERTMKVLGKGNKERVVGFSSVLEGHLRRYLERRRTALAAIGEAKSPWLFPNQCGGKAAAKGYQKRLKQYGKEAGIEGVRVSPHTFRHTFAVWFVRKGGSPFHLQKILGHTSLDMSRRYCELADVDFITKQQELSPLATTELGSQRRKRLR
jgi:integrase/recombinase XerD